MRYFALLLTIAIPLSIGVGVSYMIDQNELISHQARLIQTQAHISEIIARAHKDNP